MAQTQVNQLAANNVDISIKSTLVTYEQRPDACQGNSRYVTWSFVFNNPIPAETIVLSLVNHQGVIELRNLTNTGSMSQIAQRNTITYSHCAPYGWRHKYPVRLIETKSGATTDMLALEVHVTR
jgi:hypothetical protein